MTELAQQQPEEESLPRTQEAVDCWLENWGRAEPLTGRDVERLIEVNRGTAEGLYLGHRDLQGAELGFLDLKGANLQGANLLGANLQGANLQDATLQGADLRDAHVRGCNLQGSCLAYANLEGANIEDVNLGGAELYGARIDRDTTRFQRVLWGRGGILQEELSARWEEGQATYRVLKQWCQYNGDHDTAGMFHYREWECKRRLAQQHWKLPVEIQGWPRKLAHKRRSAEQIAKLWLFRFAGGYGEQPERVIGAGVAVITLFALFYFPHTWRFCLFVECWIRLWEGVWQSLYFSVVSFAALSYGGVASNVDGGQRILGVVESLIGILLIALFLFTFTRKITR